MVTDSRELAIQELADGEAALRSALVSLGEEYFLVRRGYEHTLRLADDARKAARDEVERLRIENADLREENQKLKDLVARMAVAA